MPVPAVPQLIAEGVPAEIDNRSEIVQIRGWLVLLVEPLFAQFPAQEVRRLAVDENTPKLGVRIPPQPKVGKKPAPGVMPGEFRLVQRAGQVVKEHQSGMLQTGFELARRQQFDLVKRGVFLDETRVQGLM